MKGLFDRSSSRQHARFRRVTTIVTLALALPLLGVLEASNAAAFELRTRALQEQLRVERELQLGTLAQRYGVEPTMLLDRSWWLTASAREAALRRAWAIAGLPREEAPAWLVEEQGEIRRRQAIHTLVGLLGSQAPLDFVGLPVEVPLLYVSALASRTRLREAPDVPDAWPPSPVSQLMPFAPPIFAIALAAARATTSDTAGPLGAPLPSDTEPTLDAASDHPLIQAKAAELGHDAVAIHRFVFDEITTELYFGSKKGAVGTLREGGGNDVDQASLLVALLRASGVPSRYALGRVALSEKQALALTGATSLPVAMGVLQSAGYRDATFHHLGPQQGMAVELPHVWVRAYVPMAAYRGLEDGSGAAKAWAHLGPALGERTVADAVDLRGVTFDFDAYLGGPQPRSPLETFEGQLRDHIAAEGIACETLAAASRVPVGTPAKLDLLPGYLAARPVGEAQHVATLPADLRHRLRVRALTSQAGQHFAWEADQAALWGKSVTMRYVAATTEDASSIASYGGLENTPAFAVELVPVLEVDGEEVARGLPEVPGQAQRARIDLVSPALGVEYVQHPLVVGGVYAFTLDPGTVPSALVAERTALAETLDGDRREAERLHAAALSYFHDLVRARQRLAGLHWHALYKETEEAMAGLVPRVDTFDGIPLRITRDVFAFDAAKVRYGTTPMDGDDARTSHFVRLAGFQGSYLEHVLGERGYPGAGPFYSSIKLLQLAAETGVDVVTFTNATVDAALAQIEMPPEVEERMKGYARSGRTVTAPVRGYEAPVIGELQGFVATDAATGEGAYIVNFSTATYNGGAGPTGSGGGPGDPGCNDCGESTPVSSDVHLLSGNYTLTLRDLQLPARGIPLAFTRTYSSQLGWTHGYAQRLVGQSDGTLLHTDEQGLAWVFQANGDGAWEAPPERFQTVARAGSEYVMRYRDGMRAVFDAATGRLLSKQDLNGNVVSLIYDATGRLERIRGTGGAWFELAYDAAGRWSSVTDSAGRSVAFSWDERGDLVAETDVLGHSKTYVYDEAHRMVEKTDFRGNLYRIDYDGRSRAVRIIDPLDGVRTFAYDLQNRRTLDVDRRGHPKLFQLDPLGNPTRTVDALGNEKLMTYDADGNRLSTQDARGAMWTATYDGSGRALSRTNPLGETTWTSYDANGRVLSEIDAAGHETRHVYDAQGNRLVTTDAAGHQTQYTYEVGLPVQIARPGGAVTRMTYDARGLPRSMTDAEGHETVIAYTAAGHLDSMTDGNGATTHLTMDAKGQMLLMMDPLGQVTTMRYDADGNRTELVDALDQSTRFEFDELSRQVAVTDALGGQRTTEYDADGRSIAQVDARGYRTELSYDPVGRLREMRDPAGGVTTNSYCAELRSQPCMVVDPLGFVTMRDEDALDRVVAETDPNGDTTETTYDALGRVETMTDPMGFETSYLYDALGRLTGVVDALGGLTGYEYDARGNRVALIDANGHRTEFDYDFNDRMVRETTPIQTVTEFTYDGVGNRVRKLDGKGQLTQYVFDAARRLERRIYGDGTTAEFEYDARGSRVYESNVDSTRFRTYDELGRLATVLDVETGRTITYGYDADGMRTSMLVTPDEELTTYVWEGRGKLVKMTDPDDDDYYFAYDAAGRRVVQTYPNGMVLTQAYDAAGQILSMVYQGKTGDVLKSFGYRYDPRGNRLWKMFEDGGAELYGYDALSRLVRATYPSGRDVQYVYDPVGNRLEMHEGRLEDAAPCVDDLDCDGVLDVVDNCPSYANPGQEDSDSDVLNVPGAQAAWSFEGEGLIIEDRAGDHAGQMHGQVSRTTAGRFGAGLSFDGGWVALDSAPLQAASAFSVSGWLKTTDKSATLFRANDASGAPQLHLRIAPPTGALRAEVAGTITNLGGASVTDGAWHHLTLSRDDTGILEWSLDGTVAGSTQTSTSALDVSTAAFGDPSSPFDGALDEWSIYSRPIAPEEVDHHAQHGLRGDATGDLCDQCPLVSDPDCEATDCLDEDGDGFGQPGLTACAAGTQVDCDDADPTVHPGLSTTCQERVPTGVESLTYTYNGFNQLVDATSSTTGVTTFAFDRNGNRTRKDATAAGAGTTAFVWDARDRLVRLTTSDGVIRTFGYDFDDMRVHVSDSSGDRRILLDGVEEYAEYDATVPIQKARLDHDPTDWDQLLAQRTVGDGKHQFVTDALGSVYGLADGAEGIASSYTYGAYGTREVASQSVETRWGFTGRSLAGALNDGWYVRARYLDAAAGTWTARDPMWPQMEPHPYGYVGSAPTNAADPTGLAPSKAWTAEGMVVFSLAALLLDLASLISGMLLAMYMCLDPSAPEDPLMKSDKIATWGFFLIAFLSATIGLGAAIAGSDLFGISIASATIVFAVAGMAVDGFGVAKAVSILSLVLGMVTLGLTVAGLAIAVQRL